MCFNAFSDNKTVLKHSDLQSFIYIIKKNVLIIMLIFQLDVRFSIKASLRHSTCQSSPKRLSWDIIKKISLINFNLKKILHSKYVLVLVQPATKPACWNKEKEEKQNKLVHGTIGASSICFAWQQIDACPGIITVEL